MRATFFQASTSWVVQNQSRILTRAGGSWFPQFQRKETGSQGLHGIGAGTRAESRQGLDQLDIYRRKAEEAAGQLRSAWEVLAKGLHALNEDGTGGSWGTCGKGPLDTIFYLNYLFVSTIVPNVPYL